MIVMTIASLIITLREGIEIALVVSIVLVYLRKTERTELNRFVILGGIGAAITSVIVAIVMNTIWSSVESEVLPVFEGSLMLLAAVMLTTMIIWMWNSRGKIAGEIEESVQRRVNSHSAFGLFLLVFALVLREGVELVLFTAVLVLQDGLVTFIGFGVGAIVASIIGWALYKGTFRVPLGSFFKWTSILLIFFAAGMVAYGIHELQEGGIILIGTTELWDINPPLLPDGSYPLLHEKGLIGSLAKSLFGYNGNPSLLEMVGYLAYLGIISLYFVLRKRNSDGFNHSQNGQSRANKIPPMPSSPTETVRRM